MRLITFLVFLFFSCSLNAQNDTLITDTVSKPLFRRNIIKWNPTPALVWGGGSALFSYERVLSPHQSFSVSIGSLSLPGLVSERTAETASFNFERSKSIGYTIIADYRFYLKSENKHFAPRGFYVSPYVAHHNHWWESQANLTLNSGEFINADINAQLITAGFGAQIGYQFSLFDDRFTIDLITFAPSYTFYQLTLGADSDSNFDFEEYYPEMAEWLLSKYPWLQSLTEEQLVDFKGSSNTFSVGTRFVIQLGYRF